ncbi:MAG: tetratricopeptide repeat protein, partial [Aromatoleum sp.]|nr:tetratricopeptide repeat protein [Aromatoleum sp.]
MRGLPPTLVIISTIAPRTPSRSRLSLSAHAGRAPGHASRMVDSDPGQPNSARNLASATQLHARGELDDAARIYEELLQRTPGSAPLLTSLGLLRMQQGRLDDAMALVDRALAVDPAAAEAHGWRGEILRRQRALEPAIDAFRAALA